MTCHDHCRFAQRCRLDEKSNHRPDSCYEYLHWEDMAWDAERAKEDHQRKDEEELPFDDWPEEAEEVMDFAEEFV